MILRPITRNAVASSLIGAALITGIALPAANADDPLGPIKFAVDVARAKSACPERLAYSGQLEGIAQARARSQQGPGYNGTIKTASGSGDPEKEAIDNAMKYGGDASAKACDYTEYGVGFVRNNAREWDDVWIVFGIPAKAEPPPVAAPAPAPAPVPGEHSVGPHFGAPPTDAVQVSFDRGLSWTVNVKNSADLPGQCSFVSKNPVLPGTNKNFAIDPKGSTSFTVLAPPPFSTFHVVVSCHGTFNGKDVEFGRVEQDVSA